MAARPMMTARSAPSSARQDSVLRRHAESLLSTAGRAWTIALMSCGSCVVDEEQEVRAPRPEPQARVRNDGAGRRERPEPALRHQDQVRLVSPFGLAERTAGGCEGRVPEMQERNRGVMLDRE